MEVFEKDCLVRLGTCIAPRGIPEQEAEPIMEVEMTMPNGSNRTESLIRGDLIRVPLEVGEVARVKVTPHKQCDIGQGSGETVEAEIEGGVAGVLLDARGRPIQLPEERTEMRRLLLKWFKAVDMYPEEHLERFESEVR